MSTDIRFVIKGQPITKKNSQRMVKIRSRETGKDRMIPMPSSQYKRYSEEFMWQIPHTAKKRIATPVNVKCVYYMGTRRKVDLTNLNEAVHDILVDAEVLSDDNRDIVASTDGCRVFYDKANPRTEITITDYEDDYDQWKEAKA